MALAILIISITRTIPSGLISCAGRGSIKSLFSILGMSWPVRKQLVIDILWRRLRALRFESASTTQFNASSDNIEPSVFGRLLVVDDQPGGGGTDAALLL